MKQRILTLVLLTILGTAHAQLTSFTTVEDASCSYSTDGTITYTGVEGIFAPIQVVIDSNITLNYNSLKNDGYTYLNQGAGPGPTITHGVWSGMTSIGDVYIATGYFKDSITFDTVTLYGSGVEDMFLVCYSTATSEVLWATSAGSGTGTYATAYSVTGADDKVYVTGYFEGTCDFQNQSIVSAGSYQAYIAKYDIPTGDIDTVIQIGNTGSEYAYNIKYAAGRIYMAGCYNAQIVLAGNLYPTAGNYDFFVTCFDTTLTNNLWGTTGGGAQLDEATDLVAYENGGVVEKLYVVGQFRSTATWGMNNLTASGSNRDFFVAALDTTGTWLWAKKGGSTGDQDRALSIDINSTGDRLYMSGRWGGNLTFGTQTATSSGTADGFIAYLDTMGTVDTLYKFSSAGFDQIVDLKSIDDDYLVFVGQFNGTMNYGDTSFVTNGTTDAFVGLIGPNQHKIWGKNMGGTGDDGYNTVWAGSGTGLHAGGYFTGNCSAYQSGLVSVSASDAIVTNDKFTGTWDTTIVLSGLAPGDYYIVMTDSNGNTVIDTITVGAPSAIVTSATITNATNSATADGSIDLTVSGGTPGYTFQWSNSATTEDITNLLEGTYFVTITDSNGCVHIDSFNVLAGESPLDAFGDAFNVLCHGDSNGSINVTTIGGNPPITYDWSNGATTQDVSGLVAGTYSVIIADSDTVITLNFTITEPDSLLLTGVIVAPSSGTATDGGVTLNVTGGTPSYTFVWSNSTTAQNLTNVGIGVYTVTVTDSAGCIAIESYFVDTIPALSIVLAPTAVTCLNTNNGTVDMTIIGGQAPYTISWSNGATSEDISGLAAGTYSVTVTDNASQVVSDAAVVASNPQFPNPTVGPITGAASAQAWTTFNYSVPTTTGSAFTWSVTGGNVASTASNASSILWHGGPQGIVYVSETDANGCYAMDSLLVDILFVGIDEVNDGSIRVFPNPNSGTFSIELPEGVDGANITITDMTGRVVFISTMTSNTESFHASLPAGVYGIRVAADGQQWSQRLVLE